LTYLRRYGNLHVENGGVIMKNKHKHKQQDTVRLTIDFPADQHTYIKMLAAKEGMTLRQFVIEHLPSLEKGKHAEIEDDEFDEILKEMLVKKSALFKRLSKK
jgi:hypothetical protein